METVLLTMSDNLDDFLNHTDAYSRIQVAVKFGEFYLAAGSNFAELFSNIANKTATIKEISKEMQKLKFWALIPHAKGFSRDFELRRVFCTAIHSSTAIKNTLSREFEDASFKNSMHYSSNWNFELFDKFLLFRETKSSDEKNEEILQKLLTSLITPVDRSMIGNPVAVISTPFKNLTLFNTYSQGVVCNVFGEDNCLFLIDVKLSLGCEGSPVFSLQNYLLGLVMNVFTWVRGEWTGFSMVINLYPVVHSWIHSSYPKLYKFVTDKPSFISEHHFDSYGIVVVSTPHKWGTGIVIDKGKGIIVTCSHVVNFTTQVAVTITFKNENFRGEVLYATFENTPFDLAVIKMYSEVDQFKEIIEFKNPTKIIEKGEMVYVIAYPLFSSRKYSIKGPSVTQGYVADVYPNIMILTTCVTNSGASGGALIRANGELLGVVANNILIKKKELLVPHITIAIPYSVFWTPVKRFCQSGKIAELESLKTYDRNIRNVWDLIFAGKFTKSKL